MASREKTVHISGQSRRYLKECVRLVKVVDGRDRSIQFLTDLAIRLHFRSLVRIIQKKDLADMLNDQLVRDAGIELQPLPEEQPQTGKEETARKEPQDDDSDID